MMRTLEELRAFFAADSFAMEQCGITIDSADETGAVCSMPITEKHLNAGGVAQGGAIFTLCDLCFAAAANAGGMHTVSQGANIHYLRPGTGERLIAKASCISAGRTTCLYRVDVTNDKGKLIAYATVSGFRKAESAKEVNNA